jgi:hypothetical protein
MQQISQCGVLRYGNGRLSLSDVLTTLHNNRVVFEEIGTQSDVWVPVNNAKDYAFQSIAAGQLQPFK